MCARKSGGRIPLSMCISKMRYYSSVGRFRPGPPAPTVHGDAALAAAFRCAGVTFWLHGADENPK
jgi:hypothetical protein